MQPYHRPAERHLSREPIKDTFEERDPRVYVSPHDEILLQRLEALKGWGKIDSDMLKKTYQSLDRSPEAMRRFFRITDFSWESIAIEPDLSRRIQVMETALKGNVTGKDIQNVLQVFQVLMIEPTKFDGAQRKEHEEKKFFDAIALAIHHALQGENADTLSILLTQSQNEDTFFQHVFYRLEESDQNKLIKEYVVHQWDFEHAIKPYRMRFFEEEVKNIRQVWRVKKLLKYNDDQIFPDEDHRRDVKEILQEYETEDWGEYNLQDIILLLQTSRKFDTAFSFTHLLAKNVTRETAIEAINNVFESYLWSNIGHAIQFVWRYPELNIRNIPHALNEAGLKMGQWIPQETFNILAGMLNEGKDADTGILCARKTHALTPSEFQEIQKEHPQSLEFIKGKPSAEAIMRELIESEQHIPDENIRKEMKAMSDYFGADITLQYANRVDLSRHDAFHFAHDIIAFAESSNLPKKEISRVLLEVAKDDASYNSGNAHTRFAEVIQVLAASSVEQILDEAKQFPNIAELQKLVKDIEANSRLSWKRMKKLYDLKQFLGRRELLEELEKETNTKRRTYILKLALNENIAMDRVLQFWKEPGEFLDIDDGHTESQINAVKKPANYLSLPYLGMNAEDLRDALIEGSLDSIQTLPPMERTYVITNGKIQKESQQESSQTNPFALHATMVSAVGMQRKGIEGTAQDSRMLFGKLQAFFKERGVKWNDAWEPSTGVVLLSKMSDADRQSLFDLLHHSDFGIITKIIGDEYRVIIGNKSDPDMVIAGNDTASCMPFGSGKNNVYMYNPNCVQLVVQRKTGEGMWRTAAQSVVSIDVETGKPTPKLIEAYKSEGKLKDLVDIEKLVHPGVITCDNIEPAKNEEGNRLENIRLVYTKFFEEYLAAYAPILNVDATKVIVGTGYTPAHLGLPSVANTYIPLAPMGYSDNIHETALEIRTGLAPIASIAKTGVTPMQTRDVLSVTMLEGKAYHDNTSLLENLHGMQNNIIGMDIANAHFKRPNLSFVYRDEKGLPKGYMLAYEGRNGSNREIYLSDLAADPESKLAGGRLIASFFGAYTANYGTAERPFLPIFTNARDKTSYRIIQNQFERMLLRANLVGEIVEVSTHYRDQDLFHDLRLFVGRTKEDIKKQKREYESSPSSSNESYDFGEANSWDEL